MTKLQKLLAKIKNPAFSGNLSRLPTFGGDDIEDTNCIWSWDATHKIIGTCFDDFQIVPRDPLE